MYREHTVGVVIPAYNEAGFVGDVIETVPEYVDRIYPVDDCSTDRTWNEIQATMEDRDESTGAMSTDGGTSSGDHLPAPDRAPGENGDRSTAEGADSSATTTSNDAGSSAASTDVAPSATSTDTATSADTAPSTEPADADSPAASTGDAPSDADVPADGANGEQRVVPIRHDENRGVGGAIKTGYQRARADEIDVTVVMGGDGQMDPDWMADLLDPIVDDRAAYAKANRLLLSEHHETMPRHRFVGNHALTILTKIATGYWSVGDPQHGYTAISLEALETIDLDELYEFFGYCNDLLIRLSAANLRVADVPCPLTYADEQSHIAYSSYVPRVSGMLLRSFLRRLWADRDSAAGRGRLALFLGGAIATVGGLLGLLASRIAATSAETPDDQADDAPSSEPREDSADDPGSSTGSAGPAAAVAATFAGVASLLGAMLLDAVTNSTNNYTERVPDDAEPRVGNEQ